MEGALKQKWRSVRQCAKWCLGGASSKTEDVDHFRIIFLFWTSAIVEDSFQSAFRYAQEYMHLSYHRKLQCCVNVCKAFDRWETCDLLVPP